jgi:hypothetical protein
MTTTTTTKYDTSIIIEEEDKLEMPIYICENTDGVLDPIEQMIYALNETQVKYGSVVVLKNAP